jgi:putative ABC transport system substrate-binding protein
MWVAAFIEELAKAGWKTGVNLQVEYRWGGGNAARTQAYAAELANLAPAVIFGQGTPVATALKKAGPQIPVVFVNVADPVRSGLVSSFADPGGNITGFSNFEHSMGGKWLELLRETAPSLRKVLVILNPDSIATPPLISSIESAANTFSFQVIRLAVRNAQEIEGEINKFSEARDVGLMALPDFISLANRDLIIDLATRHKMPSIFPFKVFSAHGGLMSMGVDTTDAFRRAATYVDRILRGARPRDLPVQAPTKLEFVINLKTAAALNLAIPPSVLARADEVIE